MMSDQRQWLFNGLKNTFPMRTPWNKWILDWKCLDNKENDESVEFDWPLSTESSLIINLIFFEKKCPFQNWTIIIKIAHKIGINDFARKVNQIQMMEMDRRDENKVQDLFSRKRCFCYWKLSCWWRWYEWDS